ncbi:Copia protein, partial [Mucuna pruriens]
MEVEDEDQQEKIYSRIGIAVMHQSKYTKDLLRKLNMQQSNPTGTSTEVGLVLEKETDEELVDPSHYRKILEALMKDLQVENLGKIKLLVGNKFAIDLARHLAAHGRSKHIETRFYFLREQVSNEKLRIEYYKTKIQLVDILTKALKLEKFRHGLQSEKTLPRRGTFNQKLNNITASQST